MINDGYDANTKINYKGVIITLEWAAQNLTSYVMQTIYDVIDGEKRLGISLV
ncbi:hypothetical protein [Photobacterium jeanii]|uniref:hypothetical protein n=1 Tax=Photobacterium jeanii TaxID=858640 RepID=UPI000AC3F57C|nr:hypothetical protein [Photobacterium jeanii]